MSAELLTSLGIIFAVYILSLGLTYAVRNYLIRRAVLDHPNERSSHTVPTPRGGGWAVILILIPGMIVTGLLENNMATHFGLMIGTIMLAFISWRDDQGNASVSARLATHILAACFGSLAFPPNETIFNGLLPFWLDRSLMIVAWAWFINLTNFMDGIDGITSAETISIATGVSLVFTAANIVDPFASTLTLLLTGACLGFLVMNWYPAKIFLGDIGSVSLGYLMGYLLLLLAVKGQWAAALILPGYYLADSGLVLAKRTLRLEKIWQPHREHFYQRAAESIGRHDKIVWWMVCANILLLFAAIASVSFRWAALTFATVIVAILLRKMHKSAAIRG
jgi:UDP-N-acetylmuramyl pentapeptide phosphotransferase/UDP-N-acetylglucosamine-1-phosphate transferase